MSSDVITWLTTAPTPRLVLAATAGLILLTSITSAWEQPRPKRKSAPKTLPSPLSTMSPTDLAAMTYSPHRLPGARDVSTPYGNTRVYEWGPASGKRILFIHGDATPSPLFEEIAHSMVEKGCRVMLFDLWGRGFTDTPLDVRHDGRLFATQIWGALGSSAVDWVGRRSARAKDENGEGGAEVVRRGFSIVGFSMGGGIAMDFASSAPEGIEDLVLMGSTGLLTKWPGDYASFKFQPGWWRLFLPKWYVAQEVRKLLGFLGGSHDGLSEAAPTIDSGDGRAGQRLLYKFDVPGSVSQQLAHHEGFLHSFLDSIAYAPIAKQHRTWAKVFNRMSKGAGPKRILFVFGEQDTVIDGRDTLRELDTIPEAALAKDKWKVQWVPGDHGFPAAHSEEVVEKLCAFWGL